MGRWPGAVARAEPLVLWRLPGAGNLLGTCITAGGSGPLHGPYAYTGTISDPVYAELNHLYAHAGTSDVRLAELSALNSAKYDGVDKQVQWSYVVNGQGATSLADARAMLTTAANLAGPYTVSIAWPADATRTGHILASPETRPAGRPRAERGGGPALHHLLGLLCHRRLDPWHLEDLQPACGSGPADCEAHGLAWPGIRPCGGRRAGVALFASLSRRMSRLMVAKPFGRPSASACMTP